MSKLKKTENEIVQIKANLTEKIPLFPGIATSPHERREVEMSKSRLEELETKRRFILDHRESWLPKTIWN